MFPAYAAAIVMLLTFGLAIFARRNAKLSGGAVLVGTFISTGFFVFAPVAKAVGF